MIRLALCLSLLTGCLRSDDTPPPAPKAPPFSPGTLKLDGDKVNYTMRCLVQEPKIEVIRMAMGEKVVVMRETVYVPR
jgi:hypothetical protein